ncbi:hypothetical protein MD484_g5490, partial [Candolleomyces efflorescens]
MPPATRPELIHICEGKMLCARGTKLAKLAQCNDDALNVMLTVLEEASAGVPILRLVTRGTLAALDTVQRMDEDNGLIAQLLVDVIQTSYVVTVALQSSYEGQERIVEKSLSTYIRSFDEKLRDIHQELWKLLKPNLGVFSFINRVIGHRHAVNDLHEALKEERTRLEPLISTLAYRGTACRLPVDQDGLRKYAEEKASLQLRNGKILQSDNHRPDAFRMDHVWYTTASKVEDDVVGPHSVFVNVHGLQDSTTPNHVPRGDIKHRTKIGMVANYNSGVVHGGFFK